MKIKVKIIEGKQRKVQLVEDRILLPIDGELYSCPICQEESVYVLSLDRFVHFDGSNNRPCWFALTRMPMEDRIVTSMLEKIYDESIQ